MLARVVTVFDFSDDFKVNKIWAEVWADDESNQAYFRYVLIKLFKSRAES